MTFFGNPIFAISPEWAAALLAGPSARPAARVVSRQTPGAVNVQGVVGPAADWYVDTSYEGIREAVKRALADPHAKSVDLYVDSPGGAVRGLPETADLIREAGRTKPVRAFVTGIAASAAYWLASQASSIVLTPSGEVGSVGVIDIHTDVTGALEKAGVRLTAVTAGEHKAERAPFTALSDDARAHMQTQVDRWYGDFLGAIRRGRGPRVEDKSNYGGGRMLGAGDALRMGLVDFVRSPEGVR